MSSITTLSWNGTAERGGREDQKVFIMQTAAHLSLLKVNK